MINEDDIRQTVNLEIEKCYNNIDKKQYSFALLNIEYALDILKLLKEEILIKADL